MPYGRAVSQRGPALAAVSRATPKKSAALFERRKKWLGVGFFVVQNGGPPHRSCGRKACHQRNRLPYSPLTHPPPPPLPSSLALRVVGAPPREALAPTEMRTRGGCAGVVGVRSALHPTAPHGLYHVLRQRFRVHMAHRRQRSRRLWLIQRKLVCWWLWPLALNVRLSRAGTRRETTVSADRTTSVVVSPPHRPLEPGSPTQE